MGSIMSHLCKLSSPATSRVLVHSGTPNSSGAVTRKVAVLGVSPQKQDYHTLQRVWRLFLVSPALK